ncbi:MAG: hypothetical protein Q9M16_01420, partial [Mariprofundus sp.]|nr:hypothetical protein [Mariprofundus sp.]
LAALSSIQLAALSSIQLAALTNTPNTILAVNLTAPGVTQPAAGITQTAAFGIQTNALVASSTTSTPLEIANINAFFAANPTASGESSAASEAATSAALTLADTEDYTYENE